MADVGIEDACGDGGGGGGGGAPVCLVRGGREGLCLADEGLRMLESLREPVAVVCLAGQYRTGKSFFLNQLAAGAERRGGFRVGPTTESCTRGIWLWDPQPPVRTARGEKVLFMDTEGLAATDNDERYDAQIFALGLLLSSLFVFNTMGVIDEGAIDRLFLVSELTKHVCVSADTGHERPPPPPPGNRDTDGDGDSDSDDALPDAMAASRELAPHFPPFVWLLRDFVLDMQQDGAALSPGEYLEQSLAPRDDGGGGRRHDERNRTRASIRVLFARRECLTLVRPVTDELALRRAAELPESALRPEFVAQMAAVRARVLAAVAPKQLVGKVIDGAQLAHLARCYTAAMTSGAVPDIRAAWAYVSDATCQSAAARAVEAYDARLAAATASRRDADASLGEDDDDSGETTTILSQQAFEQVHKDAQDAALTTFKRQSVEGATRAACFQTLKQHIQKQKAAHIAVLQRRSSAFCERVLAGLRRRLLQQPLDSGAWARRVFASESQTSDASDDSDDSTHARPFERTIDALEAAYEQQARGPSKKLAFYTFLRRDAVAHVDTLVQQLATAHAAARDTWERRLSDAQHALQTREHEWKHELQAKESELRALLEAAARAEEKQHTLDTRAAEVQQRCEQQVLALATLDAAAQQLHADGDALRSRTAQLEKELEKAQLALAYREAALQRESEHAREAQQALRDELERARGSHQAETESWIRKLADQSADKSGLQKQLKQRGHELQQTQLDLELARKELDQLRGDWERQGEANSARAHELHELRAWNAALETQAADAVTSQSSALEAAEREKTRLHARLERLQAQLGRRECDRQVAAVLTECVAEVTRVADGDRVRVVEEEKALLQAQLGQLFLKISTLPDFYQREIFCSPDPTPDFFDALTS
ncbi:hypothetical protein PybrP1_008089 [[Pythium] brassicae (nom. inval.)]|nr:hypothetical protein PybrP1_008089 [[Pythium] brassicae (nom. inval.)]